MKKRIQLFSVVLLMMLMGVKSQAQLQIGTGTTTGKALPVEPYYGYTYSQQIYLASELNSLDTIYKVSFYFAGASLSNSNDWIIYMGHTDSSSFTTGTSWIDTLNMTRVYAGTFSDPGGPGWITFDIADFGYNGTDNIVIAVDENKSGYNGSSDDFNCSAVTGDRSIVYRADATNPDPGSPPAASAQHAFIPNVLFDTIAPVDNDIKIVKVEGFYTGFGSGDFDVKVEVTNDGDLDQTNIPLNYTLDNGTVVTGTLASLVSGATTSFTFTTQVNSGTVGTHNLMVYSSLATDQNNLNDTAFAVVTNVELPNTNDFESYAANVIPYGWNVINTTGSAYSYIKTYESGSPHSGVRHLAIYNSDGTSGDLFASMPPVFGGLSSKAMKLWVNGSTSGDLYVGVMTDPTDASTFVAVDTITQTGIAYAQVSISFASYTGSGKYIAFKHSLAATYKTFYLDDINLYVPQPNEMQMLSWDAPLSSIDNDNANIVVSVYNNGVQAQDTIPVSYSIDGGTTIVYDTIYSSVAPTDTFVFTFSTPAVFLSGVNECRAVVSNGDPVPGNDSVFFSMTNFDMPYVNNFEASQSGIMPNGWKSIVETNNAYSYAKVVTSNAYSAPNCVQLYNSSASTGDLIAVMPYYGGSSFSSKRVKFWFKGLSTTTSLIIGVMTNPNDASTFDAIDTITPTNTNYNEYAILFNNYSGNGKYVAFKHAMNGGTYKSIYIDNVVFDEPVQNDVFVTTLLEPITGMCRNAAANVKVIVKNDGLADQNAVPVTVIVGTTTLTANSSIVAAGGVDTVSMGTINTTVPGVFNVTAYTSLASDTKLDDTLSASFEIYAPFTVDYVDNFENAPYFWAGTSGWYVGANGHGNTSKGLYKNFYGSGAYANGAITMTRKIGTITAGSEFLFDYRIVNYSGYTGASPVATALDADSFFFMVSIDCGINYDTIYMIDSNTHVTSLNWAHKQIDMSAYVGEELVVKFEGHRKAGDFYMDLDNVGIATPPSIDLGLDTAICMGDTLTLDAGAGVSYTYLWTVNNDTIAATTSSIQTDSAATYTVEVNAPAGMAYDTIVVSVNALPVVSYTGLAASYCSDDMMATLTGTPSNGTFTGNGVSASSFDPSVAGAGTHIVTYTFTDANSCSASAMDTTDVFAAAVPTVTPDLAICIGDSATLTVSASSVAGGVFFSEYIEGSSNNKALEIYNATGATINLDEYSIMTNYNGNAWSGQYHFPAGATLAAGDVFVLANDDSDTLILAVADDSLHYNEGGYVVGFNGDDVRALYHKTSATDSALIDIIGLYDLTDPGKGWEVAGVTNATKDHSLIRKGSVMFGDTSWVAIAGTDSASSQYFVYPKNEFSFLGSHTVTGGSNTYLWSTGETTDTITVKPTTTTTYTVVVDNGNCQVTDSVIVTVNALPVVNLGNDTTIKWTAGTLTLDAGNPTATWMWNTGATTQTETFDQSNLTNATANTVYVTVTENNCTASDTLVITVMDDVSINGALDNMDLNVYPNPTKGQFNMAIEGFEGELTMNIVNLAGQVVYTEVINVTPSYVNKFDVSTLSTGVYYIKLTAENGVKVLKLVIR